MNKKLVSRTLWWCLVIGSLIGCGYQLQPPLQVNTTAQPIYIEGDIFFVVSMKRTLESNGVALSNSRAGAKSVIQIDGIHHDTLDYALAADSRLAEQQHRLKAHLNWHYRGGKNKKDNESIIDRDFFSERIQLQQPENIAAQQRETELLIDSLRKEIIDRMLDAMRHLQAQ